MTPQDQQDTPRVYVPLEDALRFMMRQGPFTPGPWHQVATDTGTIADSDNEPVAEAMERGEDDTSDQETFANARLIAAAPQLARHLYVLHEALRLGYWNADAAEWLGTYMMHSVTPLLASLDLVEREASFDESGSHLENLADTLYDKADAICKRPTK